MKIQFLSLASAFAIAGLAVASTAKLSAAPINGLSIKTAVPAATMDVRYRARHPSASHNPTYNSYSAYQAYDSYGGYPAYNNSYWGYPTYSYWGYPTYQYSYPGYWSNAYGSW